MSRAVCDVCSKEEEPMQPLFIQVEVSDDGEDYQWILACSDDCLERIKIRWKMIGEIVRPENKGRRIWRA